MVQKVSRLGLKERQIPRRLIELSDAGAVLGLDELGLPLALLRRGRRHGHADAIQAKLDEVRSAFQFSGFGDFHVRSS